MEMMYQLLALAGALIVLWFVYRTIKGKPELFTADKLSHSVRTLGVLALILIVFVAFLVLMLRA